MKKLLVSLAAAVALVAAGSPALAFSCNCVAGIGCNGPPPPCPPGVACVDVGAGVNATTLADCVEDAWSFPDFACEVSLGDPTQLLITIPSQTQDSRTIKFIVPGVNTPEAHAYKLRLELPLGGDPLGGPFNMYVKFDNRSEVLLLDGTTVFDDITNVVTSQYTNPPGGGPEPPVGVPMIDGRRTGFLVLGLLGAGVAFIVLRRR
jgi:hypothetical protein